MNVSVPDRSQSFFDFRSVSRVGPILVLLLWLALLSSCRRVEEEGSSAPIVPVDNFSLLDQFGDFHELYYYSDAKAIVLYVQGNGCPIVRNQISTLKSIRDQFEQRNVVFLMMNANPQDNREKILRESIDFKIDFPVLIDESQSVARSLAIERTGEVLVIDPSTWSIIYRGPIDDRMDYEAQKSEATHHYLRESLDTLLAGKPVAIKPSPVKGCLVTYLNQPGSPADPVTYVDHVAAILKKHCVACHREDGIGPWAMTDYETVRGWTSMIREVVRTKRMPPWDADPHIGEFANDISLSPADEALLMQWIEMGAPRGEGPDPLNGVALPKVSEWTLGEPDQIITGRMQQIPATGILPYRYEKMQIPLKEDTWIRGVEILPSNPRVLHHALALRLDLGNQPGQSKLWVNVRPPPPNAPPGTVWINWLTELVAAYAPGESGQAFPQDTGVFLRTGSEVLLQYHYTTTGRLETDIPRIGLYFSKQPPKYVRKTCAPINYSFLIPPNTKTHRVTASYTFEREAMLFKIGPHMHYRGKWMKIVAHYPNGKKQVLLSVPNYQFDWQRYYVLQEPLIVPAGTRVVAEGAFDNSIQNRNNPDPNRFVRWGKQSEDEMFFCSIVYREMEDVDSKATGGTASAPADN